MDNGGDLNKPGRRGSGFIRLLWVSTLLIDLLVVGIVGLSVEHRRGQEVARATTLTENYAKILNAALVGFIGKIDITLRTVQEEIQRQMAHGGIDPPALEAFIASQDKHIPEVLGVRVVDADGVIRYAVNDVKIANASIADRPQFIRLRDDRRAGLVISKPVLGRAAQKWIVTLSRRLERPDGSFAGDVHVAIEVDRFIAMFSAIDLGAHGNIGLWDQSSLIARYTRDDAHGATIGSTSPSAELHRLLNADVASSNYHTRSGVDNILRNFHFSRVGDYPLYLVIGLAEEDYLGEWRKDARTIGGLAGLFVVVSLFFTYLLHRNWLRGEAEHAKLLRQEADYATRLEVSNRAMEVARRQSELILESAGEGICGVDLDGRIVFINPAAREMFGWGEDEGIGASLHLQTHHHRKDGTVYPAADCPIDKTLLDGRRRQVYDDLYYRKDGTAFPVEYTVSAVEQDGRISGAVNVFRDISVHKKNEAELEQYRRHLEELVDQRTAALLATEARASHILYSSADGLYGTDPQGIITFINPAACAMLGYADAAQVVGRAAHPLLHHSRPDGSPYPADCCPSFNALTQGDKVRVVDEVYWRADGQPVPVMYATHPMLQDGRIVGAVTSFVDVTEQRVAAEAREQALLAAEHLATVRREFLANMSHEIRTPLNGVLGFAEIGYRNYQNSEKARAAFAKIQASGNRLLGVINDILDFSKIEAGKLRIEQAETSLSGVVDSAIDLVRERAEAKHLELRREMAPDLPENIISDALRLGQVLLNILSNAVKFTERGSVTLAVSNTAERLHFRISDSGIGMSEAQLGELFNPFQQADTSATRRFGGTGLGLAISKRILDQMGGSIEIASQPGHGTTVDFSLPLVRAVSPVAPAPAREPERLDGIAILVAEDEPVNQAILEENLRELGARVTLAGNGRQVVERFRQAGREAFDIVLMDIQMPDMDGYAAARQILEIAPGMPIVAQTAHAFGEEREKCRQAGMVDHLAKPIDIVELAALVRKHAGHGGRRAGSARIDTNANGG